MTYREFLECPIHGRREVVDWTRTGGADPYRVEILACGCGVVCYGPGEPYVVFDESQVRRCRARHRPSWA